MPTKDKNVSPESSEPAAAAASSVEPSKAESTEVETSTVKSGTVQPSHYVGIGASAGGLEALQEFMRHMPVNSGLAFIIVQHLSPDFKSMMDELLSRHTTMRIFNAVDGVVVEANTVYLIPPKKNMMIAEGKLILIDQMPDRGNNFPIDIFFRSLAEDQLHRSVAVVLSGTGSDGSRGVPAIKEVGGLVVVQEPEDAKFDGMPTSAIRTGLVDVVVPIDQIPARIIKFISHPLVSGEQTSLSDQLETAESALQDIYELLRMRSDIDFTQYKSSTISRRIERRIGLHGLTSVSEYHALLQSHPSELQTLAKDMLIGVTRFFRDTESFNEIRSKVIPTILDQASKEETIRVWVAGCSTGQEAYSLAILFDEEIQKRGIARTVKIFATDVDPDAIAEASAGQFNINEIADVGEERFNRYFLKSDEDLVTISPSIRQMVVFATHNLLKDPPFSNCQLAVCRNVLIYFQPKAQRQILSMLHFAIQRDGYLFLGGSESLGDLTRHFDVHDERNRIYRKNPNVKVGPGNFSSLNSGDTTAKKGSVPSVESLVRNYQQQKTPSFLPLLEALIDDYVPACIILNEDLEVQHVYGDVHLYTRKLKAGRFSAKINDFISEGLGVAVSTAINRASTDQKNVQYSEIRFTPDDGTELVVKLRVIYIAATAAIAGHMALVFEHTEPSERELQDTLVEFNVGEESQQRIHDLEVALKKNQEHLQVTIEELETANEELQSSNEELMASNEELQSTNEELQSVNEELYTVNSEYQEKIEEVTQINMDIDNIIKSADIGFIFLDDAMLIRRFSPVASEVINLLATDIGRPFHHISHALEYESLLNDISFVIESESSLEKEIATTSGGTMLVKISPYFDEHRVALGSVLTLTDITEMRSLKSRLKESYSQLRSTIDSAFWQQKKQLTILVVDDNEVDQMMIVSALKSVASSYSSYEIIQAGTYEEAKTILAEKSCDICLIDYNLGKYTGFDLIDSLRKGAGSPAFIVLSGVMGEHLYEQAIALGIYDVIDKKDISAPLLERSIRYTQRHKQTEMYLSNKTH
ncbi:chemotaxis protein CheB [Teredinibacter waterburyi]|uniref:chemotaxis protein CheB n=1 Tax=Teredinibacter waterburyi TaxID=1500538 RepID=UPI00165F9D72|nr:chemotaxis protein CheB [Teredinibacter waterburyi]